MNIVFFAHPDFLNHQSMPRFTKLLADGMKARGHKITIWMPEAKAIKLSKSPILKKWFGYIDQFFFFPKSVKRKLKLLSDDTLFVFTDHALGPWVPLVINKPHVIHCHDFLAQKSALNQIPQNPTSWTGKQYQKYIRDGYSNGKNFISVSKKTKEDLHQFLSSKPQSSTFVYNGLNQVFVPQNKKDVREQLSKDININLNAGYILHVGGNQWYKNRVGLIEIYDAWRNIASSSLPLILIGQKPDIDLAKAVEASPYKKDIHYLSGMPDSMVKKAYAGASLFLFPSLAEGFGWPIAEAMASGCPVVTTNEAPMSEVGGNAAFYIPLKPIQSDEIDVWSSEAAAVVNKVISLSSRELMTIERKGIENAERFNQDKALDAIERQYIEIFEHFKKR
ncbi:mannosyl transferase [Tamlana nanhaiensis]|uniref:Mannosyl transferase n=1 Tax=Neotamlana nanhaiensis TaxID=1382798 RepID=A0A0D7W7G1_9FLAO|nr:glycosyltransferase [Tamlana nanhaiensis]KJD34633.1 mannosyl transferase [Tamlana nanhaiensis]